MHRGESLFICTDTFWQWVRASHICFILFSAVLSCLKNFYSSSPENERTPQALSMEKMKEWKGTSFALIVKMNTQAFVENWKGWAQIHAQLYFQIGIGNLWDNAEANFRVAMSLIVAHTYTRRYVIFIKLSQLNLGFAVDVECACSLIVPVNWSLIGY